MPFGIVNHGDPVLDELSAQEESELRWYVVLTGARHEKRVAEQLERKDIEHFLPLYATVHRWKDRRAYLELPLFPGYVFVRLALQHRLRVLEIPSVVRFVSFSGRPAPLPTVEVETLRRGLSAQVRAEPHPYLKIGHRVRIRSGPFSGAEGILLRKKDFLRVVLSIDLIMRSVA